MLEVPKAPIRVKDAYPLQGESVLMLNKDANNSLLSEKYRSEQAKMLSLTTFFCRKVAKIQLSFVFAKIHLYT